MIAPPVTPMWTVHPRRDAERARALARALDAPIAVGEALVNRGVEETESARRFLEPALEDLHDPSLLRDVDRAVTRIQAAIERGERVLVHGDYDVDGITSTFLLYRVLSDLGARVEYRIPHRTRDGYGLSLDAIEEAHRRGCALVVTVDCGITAVEPVARARALGIDTVITDHHEPPVVLPDAVALVNPHREGCAYPFKSLAGVGVTFKVAEALLRGRGSGRSLPGLDLNRMLGACSDLLDAYGGHAFAAGLTVRRDRLPELRERFETLVRERLTPDDCVPRLVLDGDLAISECTPELVEWLDRMSPHGLDNPEPLFRTRDVTIESAAAVGGGKHLRLMVRDGTGRAEAIGFGLGDQAAAVSRAGRCDLAYVPTRNEWMGEVRLQLKVKGVRLP